MSSIDKEHYDLLSQFNALNSDIDLSAHSARFSEALSRLGQKISTHFDNEEKIFMSSEMSVDAMLAHVQAHSTILEQYTQLNLDLMDGKTFARVELLSMIKHWVIDHIVSHDVLIRDFIPTCRRTNS